VAVLVCSQGGLHRARVVLCSHCYDVRGAAMIGARKRGIHALTQLEMAVSITHRPCCYSTTRVWANIIGARRRSSRPRGPWT
jgi:hypothetical protein